MAETYYSAEDLDTLLPSRFKPQPDTSLHGWARAGAQAVNAPKRAVQSFAGMLQSAGDLLAGGAPREFRALQAQQQQYGDRDWWYRNREVGKPAGFADSLTDVAVGGILPELPGMLIPAGAVGKGARLLGAGRAAPVMGDVAAGALSGYRDSGAEAGLQAGEFGAQGTVGALLPGRFRPLLRATTEGAAGYGIGIAGQALRGHDPFTVEGQTQAGVMGVFPFAMQGRRLFSRGDVTRDVPSGRSENPPPVDSPSMGGGIPADWRLRQRVETADGRYEHVFDTPQGEIRFGSDRALGGAMERMQIVPVEPMPGRPIGKAYGPEPAQRPRRALNDPNVIEGEFTVESAALPGPPARRLLRAPEPSQPAGKGGETTNFFGITSANFLPVDNVRKLLHSTELEQKNPNQFRVAARMPEGQIIQGKLGEIHANLDAPPTAELGFVDPTGKFFNREEASLLRKGRLRSLQGGGSEGGSIDARLLASLAGATVGYAVDDERGALLGAAAGGLGAAAGRRLLRRLPSREQAARQEVTGIGGKTLMGKAARVGEKYFKAGRDTKLDVIGEQARGTVHTLASDVGQALEGAIPAIKTLSKDQKAALKIYMSSDRSPGAKAVLTAWALPKEVLDFVDMATQRKGELQQIVAEAQGDPSRRKLIQDTIGTWVTEPYRAYVNPKEWQKKGVAPAMVDRLVSLNARDPIYAGMSKEQIRADVEKWLRDDVMNFSGDFSRMASEGKSRMSQSLFTKRKTLRPIVQKILGKIHDPIEREVLSVAKLVKSATSAKVVADVLKTKDSSGNPLAMSSTEWNAEIQAALAAGDTARADFLRGYEQVPDTLPGLGMLSSKDGERMMAQRQVMDMMQAGTPHGNVDWESGWLGALGKLNRLPKAAFTLYNPGTWAHNFVQAPLQAVSAGMAPWSFIANLRRLRKDPQKLRWAKEDGIMDAHMGAGEFRRAADQYEKVLNPGKTEAFRRVHEAVKAGYGKPDQWVRGAAYMKFLDEGLAAGKSNKEARAFAVEMTNRYTQNYSNVAPAVAIARNIPLVNPFISYTAEMARIVKNLAEDVVTNANGRRLPSALALTTLFGLGAGIKKLAESGQSEEERKGLESLIPLLPNYAKGRTTVNFGWDAEKQTGQSLNLNPWLPAEDFVTTAKNILNGEWSAVAETNPLVGVNRTPVLNMLAEGITGKDPVTGAPSKGLLSNLRKNTLPQWLPGGYTYEKVQQGFTPNDEGTLGVTDDYGRRESPAKAVGRLLGVSVTQNDRKRLLARQEAKKKEEDRQAKIRLNKTLRSNVNEAAKDEARAEYQEIRRRIFQR